jgi:hypothetical protein
MGVSDKLSETHAKHAEMRQGQNLDLLRLISEGKRPASQEENERPVGEDGQPLEKLQLAPERDILRGGMPNWWWKRDDQASTSTGRRDDRVRRKKVAQVVKDLSKMFPWEHVDWCLKHGGIEVAFRPNGYPELRPVIMNMLKDRPGLSVDRRILFGDRLMIAEKIVTMRPGIETLLQVLKYVPEIDYSSAREDAREVILAKKTRASIYSCYAANY